MRQCVGISSCRSDLICVKCMKNCGSIHLFVILPPLLPVVITVSAACTHEHNIHMHIFCSENLYSARFMKWQKESKSKVKSPYLTNFIYIYLFSHFIIRFISFHFAQLNFELNENRFERYVQRFNLFYLIVLKKCNWHKLHNFWKYLVRRFCFGCFSVSSAAADC